MNRALIEALQIAVLPALALIVGGYRLGRRRAGQKDARRIAAVLWLIIDAWLWLVAVARPLGPHPVIAYALVVLHAALAIDAIGRGTGFRTFNSRTIRMSRQSDSRYSGWRGD